MECLSKLLNSIFNKKLGALERNSSVHFKCIQSTMVDTKYITTQCIMLSKRILKTNNNSNHSGSSNNVQKSISTKRDTSRSKTPKKTTSTTNVCNSTYKGKYNKTMYKSKSNGSLLQSKSVPRSIKQIYKNKSCANLIKDNNNRETVISPNHNSKTDITKTPKLQTTTKKRRQTRNLTMIEGNNSIKNRTIHESVNVYRKYKQSNKELILRNHNSLNLVISDQLLGNNINININKQHQHNHHHQHVMRNIEDENMSHILTMETNIQSDFILNKEDSLLVTPITDIDFLTDNNNDNNDNIFTETPTTESNPIYTLLSLSNFKHIAPYLTTHDLTLLTLVNKTTSLSVFTYIKHSLQTDITFIESKISSYTPSNKYQGIPKVQLSKGTTKAAELLNGPILNKIFKNKHKIPSCDVLRIYKIFFMLFDNGSDVVKAVHDKELFWERTCNYFMNGNENAKTGSVVLNMLNNEIVISYKMIYKVIKVLKGNVMKISPGFFSKKCGTTGLFTFFVKDVLDSYGLLIEEGKMNNEIYWTYVKVKDILKGYLTHIEMVVNKLEG